MEKILGIDYGSKKIGLALCVGNTAMPLEILENRENHPINDEAVKEILDLVDSEIITKIVIGLPIHKHSDNDTQDIRNIRSFGNKIKKQIKSNNIDINYIDESHTSKEALQKSAEMDISKKYRSKDDSIAACQIIYRYLELQT